MLKYQKTHKKKREMKSFHMHIYRKKKRKQFKIRTQVCNRPSLIFANQPISFPSVHGLF